MYPNTSLGKCKVEADNCKGSGDQEEPPPIPRGKPLYSALHGVYSEVLADFKVVLQQSASKVHLQPSNELAAQEEFREQRRRKRNPSEEAAKKQKTMPTTGIKDPRPRPQQDVVTRNDFAPLRTTEIECEGSTKEVADNPEDELQQRPASQMSRPPPIVLTSEENLIRLQKKLKSLCKDSFEFRSTRNGTRVVTREMADFVAIRYYFDSQNLHYFTFYPKSQKPIKAVIRHLSLNTPAEDISDGLVNLGFDIISVKQMSTTVGHPQMAQTTLIFPSSLSPYLGHPSPKISSRSEAFAILQSKWRPTEPRRASRNVTTARISAMSGQTASNLHVVCGVGAVTCRRTARKKKTWLPNRLAVTASWGMERSHTPPTTEVAATPRRSCGRGSHRGHPNLRREGSSLLIS
jgi:hypothetical protein